jgi:hypothetical protein
MNYRCYQIKQRVKQFYTNRSSAKCGVDIYRWGAGLAVTGPIRDIGQNVLQASFEPGSSSSTVNSHILLLTAFFVEVFIRKMT